MLRKKLKLSEQDSQDAGESSGTGDIADPADKTISGNCANPQLSIVFELEFWEKIWRLEQELADELMKINFKSDKNIAAVYNPLDYAADVHKNYMRKYLKKAPAVLFLGMNPGLFGMCQTAVSASPSTLTLILIFGLLQVPFGDVKKVRDWMKLEGEIRKPANEIASRPIEGFNCKREEQSGKRFWGVLQELCVEPENFFEHCFVYNICPFAFLTSSGSNITPPEIKVIRNSD